MNEHIHIKQVDSVKYHTDREDGSIACNIRVSLYIFGEVKHFHGSGIAHCTKENIFNEPFGKALAGFRASQDIYRQIEISLVKYTFDHFVRQEEPKIDQVKKLSTEELEQIFIHMIETLRRSK